MRLTWAGTVDTGFTAEGTNYSYSVTWDGSRWVARQMRQPGGQVVNAYPSTHTDGAFARSQTWENDDRLR